MLLFPLLKINGLGLSEIKKPTQRSTAEVVEQNLSTVQFSRSVVSDSAGLQHTKLPLSITNSQGLLKLMSIGLWYHPTISSSVVPSSSHLQSFLAPGSFSNESVLRIRWPKYCNFSFSINPSNEHAGLISFRTDWFDLLAVQRILKSVLQHQTSKASVLKRSAFFMVQLSHPYLTKGKTIDLTRQSL